MVKQVSQVWPVQQWSIDWVVQRSAAVILTLYFTGMAFFLFTQNIDFAALTASSARRQ